MDTKAFSFKKAANSPKWLKEIRGEHTPETLEYGISTFTFNNDGTSFDLQLDKFDAKMKIHPLRFEKFNGRIHYEKDHIVIEDFSGKLGHSTVTMDRADQLIRVQLLMLS